ncbi:MAG: hypothetical protein DRQ55_06385 [Planctomycetota bacterium]|nr:MAG: hypothetical protein DRQ55_06385 [Planctomycetota bacterium]
MIRFRCSLHGALAALLLVTGCAAPGTSSPDAFGDDVVLQPAGDPASLPAPVHDGDHWRVTHSAVGQDEASAAGAALAGGRALLLAQREVHVSERMQTLTRFRRSGVDVLVDEAALEQSVVSATAGVLHGSRELSSARAVTLLPDGRVRVDVVLEVGDADLFPERRMQQLLASHPPRGRAQGLVQLARDYALEGQPGLAAMALDAAESDAAGDARALLDVADLLLELGHRGEALRVNDLVRSGVARGSEQTQLAARAAAQHERLVSGVAPLSQQLFALERATRGAERPELLSVAGAESGARPGGSRALGVTVPGGSGRLLMLRMEGGLLQAWPLGEGPLNRRKLALSVGAPRHEQGAIVLLWLLPEGSPVWAAAEGLPPDGVAPGADERERMLVAALERALREAAARPDVGAYVLHVSR